MKLPVNMDGFGRCISYLRISLTDHCNLRCLYCMPDRDQVFGPDEEILTAQEIQTVVSAAAQVGFNKIRLTGGEPTLRRDLVDIVRQIKAVDGIDEITMTTNGLLLRRFAEDLAAAGLGRVNIHVDTFNAAHAKNLMRLDNLEQVWAGIRAAEKAGLSPIKLNVVVALDHNDQDVAELARLTLEHPWHVRFIELMPIGADGSVGFSQSQFVPTRQTQQRIENELGALRPVENAGPSDESRNYKLPDSQGVVGFISPVSQPYCGTCNRMRLTADGKFHLCLLNDDEVDVKAAMRSGGGVDDVAQILLEAVRLKPTGHRLSEGIHTENRGMFQIGG